MSKQLLVSTILAGAAVVGAAPVALAQPAPSGIGPRPADATLRVAPAAGIPGSTVTVTGTGCLPNGAPGIGKAVIGGGIIPINPSPANAEGTWTTSAKVPAGVPAGRYEITGGCGSAQGSWNYAPIEYFVGGKDTPEVHVSDNRVAPGTTIRVSGSGCTGSGNRIEVGDLFRGADSVRITTVSPDAGGNWSTGLQVPGDARLGSSPVGAYCMSPDGARLVFYIPAIVEVTNEPDAPAPSTTTPSTPTTKPKAVKVKPRFTG